MSENICLPDQKTLKDTPPVSMFAHGFCEAVAVTECQQLLHDRQNRVKTNTHRYSRRRRKRLREFLSGLRGKKTRGGGIKKVDPIPEGKIRCRPAGVGGLFHSK
jgi:hypothetical protein